MCKKISFSISLVLALVLAGSASAGLVGHWKLDDGSGTTAVDATGNGHDGTLIGNPQWVAGHSGGGLEFSGSADKVDIPHSADLNPENEFTASVWANLDPAGSNYRSPITSRDDGPQRGYIIYCTPANTWQFWTGTGSGWNSAGSPDVEFGEWTHVAATYSGGDKKLYVNGELAGESSAMMTPNTAQVLRIGAGATEGAGNYFFHGMIDDVRVYDRALSAGQVAGLYGGIDPTFRKAEFPDPSDGAMHEATWATLGWSPGDAAVSHDVYIGDNFDDVSDGAAGTFQGNQVSTTLIVGFAGYPVPEGLVPGTTYYWRVDGVNPDNADSPWKGDVWSFWIPPKIAYEPSPADGINYVAPDAKLSWTAGFGSKLHTVYFGESLEEVSNATGGAAQSAATYTPGLLATDTVYYWRVDEFEAPVTHKGDVWSFRTLPDIPVTDPSLLAWWTLDEGAGTNVLDWSGHGHHGTLAGNADWTDGYDLTAVQFDGKGDYVDFGTPADLYLPSTYTYTAWFKPGKDIREDSGAQYLLCIGSRSDLVFGFEDGVGIDGDLALHYYDTAPGFHAIGVGKTSWHADEWHMVAGTKDATGHKIYLDGELRNSDFNVNDDNYNTGRMISIGAMGWNDDEYFTGAIDDVRIYNKALTKEEILQVMEGNTAVAGDPEPARGATSDITDITSLNWSAGDGAASHDVYFGTDRDAIAGADNNSPEFQGNQAGTNLSLAGLVEFGGGAYYWRIDEVKADGTVQAGTIWKFTVPDYLTVDDIESYNDLPEDDPASNRIYLAWIDGFGTTTNGAVVGNLDVPLTERSNVHGGLQAMPYSYDNNLKTSEATLTLARQRDWTTEGVTKLSLWFRGDGANAAERMFVAVNGNAVAYHDDASVTQVTGWTEWVIELQTFADQGVNLTNVNTITIGFGTRNAPAAAGTGTMYFDDIVLIR
jgi:hypothetical protein